MANSTGETYVAAAAAIARAAGVVLLEHRGRVRIEYKGEADLVTAADRASEALIVARLRAEFPDHAVVAEEGGASAGSGPAAEFRWYVDPLDGTTNYAHGLPFFAVSLGLEQNGRVVAGVVYNPVLDEMFTAVRGAGARLNGEPIAVSRQEDLGQALLATGFPSRKRHANPNIHFYQYFSLRTHGMRRLGSAALDLCYTACGRFEGFWEFNLQPWDTAAGGLIVTEAGGEVSDMLGQAHQLRSPEILASNGHLHPALLAAFAAIFSGGAEALPAAGAYLDERTLA
ncbi:MAG TPA: inositol monophosphatase family protein [Terriglobales bacterium]|nr:inositol monophosphatase family protein [Terriglobales bacterium]